MGGEICRAARARSRPLQWQWWRRLQRQRWRRLQQRWRRLQRRRRRRRLSGAWHDVTARNHTLRAQAAVISGGGRRRRRWRRIGHAAFMVWRGCAWPGAVVAWSDRRRGSCERGRSRAGRARAGPRAQRAVGGHTKWAVGHTHRQWVVLVVASWSSRWSTTVPYTTLLTVLNLDTEYRTVGTWAISSINKNKPVGMNLNIPVDPLRGRRTAGPDSREITVFTRH